MACYEYKGVKYTEGELVNLLQKEQPKVRRILELQSDLFQKGRNKEMLIGVNANTNTIERLQSKENQFLQLLNKDNNWVTFFIKSIIQDSAKKGYEKVLFPSGDTASKVEGHSTLEEFKKQKEDRIKELEEGTSFMQKQIDNYSSIKKIGDSYTTLGLYGDKELKNIDTKEKFDNVINHKTGLQKSVDNNNTEINQLKQELARVEIEGFAALKPIYNFYENTVTNILNKNYGKENVKQITDEYGNTWNEIKIKPEFKEEAIKFSSPDIQYTGDLAIEEKLADEYSESKTTYSNNIFTQFFQWVKDMIKMIKNKSKIDELFSDINAGRFRNINSEYSDTNYSLADLNQDNKITNVNFNTNIRFENSLSVSISALEKSDRVLWNNKPLQNRDTDLGNTSERLSNTIQQEFEAFKQTQEKRHSYNVGLFIAEGLLRANDEFIGKLFEANKSRINIATNGPAFSANSGEIRINVNAFDGLINRFDNFQDFVNAIQSILIEEILGEDLQGNTIHNVYNKYSNLQQLAESHNIKTGSINSNLGKITGFKIVKTDLPISINRNEVIELLENSEQNIEKLSDYFLTYVLNEIVSKDVYLSTGYNRLLEKSNQKPKILIVEDNKKQDPFYQYNNVIILGKKQLQNIINQTSSLGIDALERLFQSVAQEEAIHLFADYLLDRGKIDKIYEEITDKDIAQIENLYGTNLSKENVVHEYIRMAVQQHVFKKTTEYTKFTLTQAFLNYYLELLNELRGFLKRIIGKDTTKKAVQDVIDFTQGNFSEELDERITTRIFEQGQVLQSNLNNYTIDAGMFGRVEAPIDESLMPYMSEEKQFRQGVAQESIKTLMTTLSEKLGVEVKVLNYEQAEEVNPEWKGETGFFYKGVVYLVGDNIQLEDVIHEFSHPFVRALMQYNSELANRLYQELPEDILNNVTNLYPREAEMALNGDVRPFMEECLVWMLTQKALEIYDIPQSFWDKVWIAFKSMLRKVFPKARSLATLNPNTTLEELSKILLFENSKIDIDSDIFSSVIHPMYNKKMLEELQKIQPALVDETIQNSLTIILNQLKKIQTTKSLSNLKMFFSEEEQKGEIYSLKEGLKRTANLINIVQEDEAKLRNFSESLQYLKAFTDQFVNHIKELAKSEIDNVEKINILRNYTYITKDWKAILDQFDRAVIFENLPELNNLTSNIQKNIRIIDTVAEQYIEEDGLPTLLSEDIKSNTFLMEEREKLKQQIETLKNQKQQGRKNVDKQLNKLQELYRKTDPSTSNIAKWLKGMLGDSNWFSAFFESASSNPNLIVGSFANFFFKQKAKAEAVLQERSQRLFNEISKLGIDKNNIAEISRQLRSSITKGWINKDSGELEEKQYFTLLNQYKGNWQFILSKFEKELQDILEANNNVRNSEWFQKKKQLEQFKQDYMFSDKTDAVNESRQFWLSSDLHLEAQQLRTVALDKLKEVQQRNALTPEEKEQKEIDKEQYLREYKQLTKETDEFGNRKTQEQLEIVNILKQYQEKFGNLYEFVEQKEAFETALNDKKLELENKYGQNEQYNKELNEWIKENITVTLSPLFYEDRQKIIDQIDAILGKTQETQDLMISEVYKEIIDLTKGYRDEDGQPIGTDLTKEAAFKVKQNQEKIVEIRKKFRALLNMTETEENEFIALNDLITKGLELNETDLNRYLELKERNEIIAKNKLSPEQLKQLYKLYEKLETLQSKIVTPYYVEKVNGFIERIDASKTISAGNSNIDQTLFEAQQEDGEDVLQAKSEFKTWFDNNHLKSFKTEKINGVFSKKEEWKPIYIWNRIVPNEPQSRDAIENEDYIKLLGLNTQYVQVKPSRKYGYIRLKAEYRTKRIKGVTVDAQNQWLPKPTENSASPEQKQYMQGKINFAKDDVFIDENYLKLKAENNDYWKLLQLLTQFHEETQKGAPNYTKLNLEIPRIRKSRIEYTQGDVSTGIKSWWQTFNPFVKDETQDAYSTGQGNYEAEVEEKVSEMDEDGIKTLVLTDVFGNQPTNIPIKYKSYVAPDMVSQDIVGSLVKYAVSVQINKLQHEVNPIAQSLKDTLSNPDNAIKQANTVAKNFAGRVLNKMANAKGKGESNTFKAVSNFIETHIEGVEKKFEFGVGYDRFANHIMKMGSLALMAPSSAIKNLISGNIQKTIEAVGGKTINAESLTKGEYIFDSKFIPNMVKDTYSLTKSLETQMMQLFDPQISFGDEVGNIANASLKRDAVDLKFLLGAQKMGEIHIQGSSAVSMLHFQQVPYVNEQGEKSQIRYLDAWEIRDGIIQLKPGVDKNWDKDGNSFAQFKLRMQKVNELLQGAYAKENQAEYQRYTNGKLAGFMRRFFASMLMNRWMFERANYATGEYREGYYQTFIRLAVDMIKTKGENYQYYNEEEKRNALKTLAEIGYSMMFMALISLLGWDDDDEDKYDKLQEMPWIQSFTIYELMLIKSETETFIPPMGINEMSRLVSTPTVAFNVIKKYLRFATHLGQAIAMDEDAVYSRKQGIYDKGDYKYIADLYNIFGIRNFFILNQPEEGIKMYNQMQKRF